MKIQKIIKELCLVSLCMAIFSFVSCGSTPKPEVLEPEPVVEPAPEPQKEEPAPEPQPETSIETETEEPAKDFSDSNKDLLGKAEAARNSAVEANAQNNFPEQFADADKIYESLKSDIEANPTVDYADQINDLIAKYDALAQASKAKTLKDKSDEMGFADVDKATYEDGENALKNFADSQTGKESLDNARKAFDSYNMLLQKGFTALAGKERNAALEAKKNADSVKAGVAKKEEYKNASDTFKKADSSYVTKDIEGAYNGYKTSREIYTDIYEIVAKNRAAAMAALERAKQKVQEAEDFSTEADGIAPLTEQVAGIESEDAVLLEEDNLANPDDAIIDVEDGETAKSAEEAAATAIAQEEVQ